MKSILPAILLWGTVLSAQGNPVIVVKKSERTDSAIVVEGTANIVPPGTRMRITVTSINGKRVDDDRDTMKTIEDVYVANNGAFSGTIKRYGSLGGYSFPDGKYQLEFYADFNRAWQSVEVAKAAGVKLDELGRSGIDSEPRALPESTDLVLEATIAGGKARHLRAIRTINIRRQLGGSSTYKTKSIRLEVNDVAATKNPVRAIPANDMLFREVAQKVGRLKPTEAVSLICVGDFQNGFGYLANDLYFLGGRPNRDFVTAFATPLSDLCRQQEDAFYKRQK